MAKCDPNDLMSRASGFDGLSPGGLDAVKTQLLCEISLKIAPTPPAGNTRITDAGDTRLTDAGDTRVWT